jgi:peptide/nickel transport system substrate-binding protein
MRTRSKRLTGLVAVGAAALLAIAACGGGNKGTGNDKGDISQGGPGYANCDKDPNTCNSGPVKAGGEPIAALEQDVTNWNIYSDEGNTVSGAQAMAGIIPNVFRSKPNGDLFMNEDLMSSVELTNKNPQTIVYKIKPEAVWSDGTPISADDFIFGWKGNAGKKELCDAKCVPASTSGWELVKSVVGSDNGKTVTMTMEDGKVYADWKGFYSTDGIYPSHIATKAGIDLSTPEGVGKAWEMFGAEFPKWSGGAFILDTFTKGQTIVLKKNDKWYGKTKSQLNKLIYKWVIDQSGLVPALRNKEITTANPQPNGTLVTDVGNVPGVIGRLGHGFQWEHLDLNLKNKYLADLALRQAVFTAINVKTIIDKTYGVFDKAAKPLGSHNFFPGDKHYKDVVTPTGQGSGDVEKAKKILTDAGYKIDGGKLIAKDGTPVPQLRFRHTKGNQLRATTAELVQADLKAIGIDMKIEVTETLGKTLSTGDFDIMIFAWVGSPLFQGAAEQNWITDGGGNYGKYSNPQVDDLNHKGAQDFDADKAADLLNQADEIMSKEAYVLPLTQKPTYTFTYSDYVNIRDNPTQWTYVYNLQEWGLKAS